MPNQEEGNEIEQLLLSKLKEDDIEAFNLLYEKYWQSIYSTAFKRLQDPDQAKDITQDVFLELWSRREKVNIDNLASYLHTAARNKVYNWMERERKFTPISDLLINLKSNIYHPDTDLLYKEFIKSYEALIGSLTMSQQQIFKMRFQQDLSTIEIAERLSISRKTVQNQLAKAVARLRASLTLIALLAILGK